MRLAVALLALCPSSVVAQQIIGARNAQTARVDSIFRAFDRTDAPGCALGIYRGGNILYARGYGMANLEHGVPITPRTVMDVGSVSKQFTATALVLLAQDRRLSLDDDVRRYVPEMPPYASSVTIRQMLNHIGALRDYLTMWELGFRSFEGVADTIDYLRLITRNAELNWPVADRYFYSNTGYALAGQIVYRVSGQSLAQFLQARVFRPLGMTDTRSMDDHYTPIPNRAQGYLPRGTGFRIQMSQWDGTGGAGSLHTTIEDFARWDRNWDQPAIGGTGFAAGMMERGRLRTDSQINYALGVSVSTWRGLRTVSHTGSWAGYRAMYVRFPDDSLSVACFCNVSNAGPDTMALKVAAVYLADRMGPDTIGAWDHALTSAGEVPANAAQLPAAAAIWRNGYLQEARRTRMRGDSLYIGFGGNRTRLVALDGGRFRVGRTSQEITFDSPAGQPQRMTIRTRGGSTVWERVDGFTPTSAQLGEFAGEYRSEELEATYRLLPDSGGLALHVNNRRRGLLEPTWRDAFAGSGAYLDFQRDPRGNVTGFLLHSGRVRNLRFVKARSAGVTAAGG